MSDKTAAPQVYGADEINSVVLDPGSYTTRAGYSGYDYPSIIIPSYYGSINENDNNNDNKDIKIFDENLLFSKPRDGTEIKSIISNNLVVDWDGAMNQWDYILNKLDINPNEQPILLTESTMNNYSNKIKSMEYFFESKNFCAFYAVKQPTCVSFAHGRPNCLIVDIGHDLTTITPIIDGLCLKNQVRGTRYAGSFLNQQLKQFLNVKSINYNAPFTIKNKETSYWEFNNNNKGKFELIPNYDKINSSVNEFSYLRTLREMKELLLECCMNEEILKPDDLIKEIDSDSTRWFELPNGLNIPLTLYEREKISNSLFNPNDTLFDIVKGWEENENGNIIKLIGKNDEITSKDYVPLRRTKKNDEEEESQPNENNNENSSNNNNSSSNDGNSTYNNNNINNDNGNNNSNGSNNKDNNNNDTTDNSNKVENKAIGLTDLVQNVLENLDIDLKPQLANNIILTGSSTLIPRLNERLNNELSLLNPSLKIRVHSAGNTTERKYASWIGGSILSSLGTFHQLWVSKAEYEEVGPDQLIINRFR